MQHPLRLQRSALRSGTATRAFGESAGTNEISYLSLSLSLSRAVVRSFAIYHRASRESRSDDRSASFMQTSSENAARKSSSLCRPLRRFTRGSCDIFPPLGRLAARQSDVVHAALMSPRGCDPIKVALGTSAAFHARRLGTCSTFATQGAAVGPGSKVCKGASKVSKKAGSRTGRAKQRHGEDKDIA